MEAKRSSAAAAPIAALGDDVLSEIFLRLPSLASVVRAACACRDWCDAASSSDFLRRFRVAHRRRLLISYVSPDFSYHPAGVDDADLIGVLRRSYLSRWAVWDCFHGLLIISENSRRPVEMAVYDPMSGRCVIVNRPPDAGAGSFFTDCLLPAAGDGEDDDDASFRVVSVQYHKKQLRAAVYDGGSNQWTFHPWVSDLARPRGSRNSIYASPIHAARCVYWKFRSKAHLLCLDTVTMEFSIVPLPPGVKATTPYFVGETRDAQCCLVSFVPDPISRKGQIMKVWLRREANDAQVWEMQRQMSLQELEHALPQRVCHVRAVAAGVVLVCLENSAGTDDIASMDHVAFCMDNNQFQVEARFKSGESIMRPYQMTWPSVLGNNYKKLKLKCA